MAEELFTVDQAAKLLNMKPRTVREYLRTGKLEGIQLGSGETVGRRWRITISAINKLIDGNTSSSFGCIRCNKTLDEINNKHNYFLDLRDKSTANGDKEKAEAYTDAVEQMLDLKKKLALDKRRQFIR